MNRGRFVLAAITVWIVRVLLNATFYSKVVGGQWQQIATAHPGMFRQVVPAYILTDLIFALSFTYLFVRVGAVLGSGVQGGVKLGILVAILSPVIGGLYHYYSVSFLPLNLMLSESVFQIIAHAVEGAVAGATYKTTVAPRAESAKAV